MSEYINNQTQRQETLKAIIRQLHAGASVEDVKEQFAELLAGVGGDEITRIEQALVAEGLDPDQIKPLCDVHVAVFRESLDNQADPQTVPGHPVFTFRAENLAVGHVLDNVRTALDDLKASPSEATLQTARESVHKLREYDKHYLRKENILFSYMERYDFSGPSKVMWAVHDDIRDMWKTLATLLDAGPGEDVDTFTAQLDETFALLDQTLRDMIYKEHKILFPAAMARLSEADWGKIRAQEAEIGYCYVMAGRQWQAHTDPREEEVQASAGVAPDGLIPLNIGALSAEQIDLMLTALPVDITFVDANVSQLKLYHPSHSLVAPYRP